MADNKQPKKNITGSYPGATGSYKKPTPAPAKATTPAKKTEPAKATTPAKHPKPAKTTAPAKKTAPPKSESAKKQAEAPKTEAFDFKMWFSQDNVRAFFKQFAYYGSIVLASILLTIAIVSVANDVFAFVKPDESHVVTIEQNASTKTIAKALKSGGVIKHPGIFRLYSKFKKADGSYQFGDYSLNSNLGYDQIIAKLKKTSVQAETLTFTITAGQTQDEIMEMLTTNKFFEYTELDHAFNDYDYKDFDFVSKIPERRSRLEGYFVPGDYEMAKGESAVSVTNKILTKFNETVLTEENRALLKQTGLSVDEVVIFASILQNECGKADMYKTAASVIYNRLRGQVPMNLCLTSPINYVLPQPKATLDINDKNIDSDYNTYQSAGLPAGPVTTPSTDAIAAVLSPETSSYLYFISDGETAYYAVSADEHDQNLKKVSKSAKGTETIR